MNLNQTLLEEAENERMHLLTCMKMFNASTVTRTLVFTAQFTMTPVAILLYLIKPQMLNRFVGFLEETATQTYANIIKHVETEGKCRAFRSNNAKYSNIYS